MLHRQPTFIATSKFFVYFDPRRHRSVEGYTPHSMLVSIGVFFALPIHLTARTYMR